MTGSHWIIANPNGCNPIISLKKELLEELVAFRGNNNGTLEKLLVFRQLNQELITLIELELNSVFLKN